MRIGNCELRIWDFPVEGKSRISHLGPVVDLRFFCVPPLRKTQNLKPELQIGGTGAFT